MTPSSLCFDDPTKPGGFVSVSPDPQTVVRPGEMPDTATVIAPDGTQVLVKGDYLDVHLRIQAAAARTHEGGQVEVPNTPVS